MEWGQGSVATKGPGFTSCWAICWRRDDTALHKCAGTGTRPPRGTEGASPRDTHPRRLLKAEN